ncbi:MAG: UDP-glucose/GDP-mannose dehydrogenase family protein [Chitinophagales bacterium]|nr:UDP-glucose/GDP-mannose dehydrogenase family protein [Chitinophagales bacterium]
MKISVIGTGYVGLVSGVCFAETGNDVICVDIDENKVNRLNNKECIIYEPGLDILLERNVDQNRISFTTDLEYAVSNSDIIFLALPTPPGGNGEADLSYVLGMADTLGKIIDSYKIIVDKSTVPVGTADLVRARIAKNAKVEFDVVSNPEFLREGVAVDDFMKPDRVVIGVSSEKAKAIMERLYKPYVMSGNPIIFMDERSAELTKYAANSFLATKISFMNEIANLCELTGANVDMVRKGMGGDDRIGKRFLFAGIGYGGSCFPKDVQALAKTAKDLKYDFKILNAVMDVNTQQKELFFSKIKDYYKGNLKNKKVALWGLSFKPNTDDIREAPALKLISNFLAEGASVQVYDPEAMENVKRVFGDKITYTKNMYEAIENTDFLVIATEWTVFRTPNFDKLRTNIKDKVIFDGRNLYDSKNIEEEGFTYFSIGRP